MKPLQHIYINPGNSILIIVDMENDFCKLGGKLRSETSTQIMPGAISTIQGLAERCRSASIPIIYIQSVRTLKEPQFIVFGLKPSLEIGTWAVEIVDELRPHEGDIIVQKFPHDPFYRTNLDKILERLILDPARYYAIVTGGSITVCAYHTIMGFYLRDYWTVVSIDSVYYLSESGKQRALEQFSERAYPNVFLSRSNLIEITHDTTFIHPVPMTGN
ncbi:isochorismatase family cysteine hydrolase [Chloroflexota bacterium]